MLAVATMSAEAQFFFYGVAVILFVIATFIPVFRNAVLQSAGLAFFAFPFAWNALAGT